MKRLIIAYSVVAIWLFGWLSGIFGFFPALFCSVLFSLPAVATWRLVSVSRPIVRREYGYVAILSIVVIAGSAFVVSEWFKEGLDKLAIFEREYHTFHRRVAQMKEFENVEVSCTRSKGIRIYLRGTVASKDSHDRLIGLIEETIHYNAVVYDDGVAYPEMPTPSSESPRLED